MTTKPPAFAMHQHLTVTRHTEYAGEPVEVLERHFIQREQKWGYFVRFLERQDGSAWFWDWQLQTAESGQNENIA